MNLKRILLANVFLLPLLITAAAQQNLQLNLDSKTPRRLSEYAESMPKVGLHVDYGFMGFFNPTYFANSGNDQITNKGGVGFRLDWRMWMFRLDMGIFYQGYGVNSAVYQSAYGTETASVYGADIYLCYMLLPDFGKVSDILQPFAGIGYQTAAIQAMKGNDDSEMSGSLGIGGLMWKTGLQVNVGKNFFLIGEYRQSLLIDEPESNHIISFGLGFKI
ncbi:MAG: porin family protein [Dysgonamonadaceae bacterium]|jgi:opacity protein-like surface antigen|nr:porin family protein [Dysgonamonadaceae bacterium]